MIFKWIFDFLLYIGELFLGLLPDIGFSVPSGVWGAAADFLNMVGFLLPVGTINSILAIMVDIAGFRISIALIRLINPFT